MLFLKIDENCCIMYVCMFMYCTCMYITLHAEVSYIITEYRPSTNSIVYTIIGATPTKSEVHMYPYIIIIIRTCTYIHVCIYVQYCLVGRRAHLWLGKCHSYCGVILDIITKKSHIRTHNDSFPLCWMVFLYVHVCAKGQAC